jgi:transcriptional regulator with XRE-family HTH domain
MRAAGYVRPSGEEDVPALSRMSGVADNILRRWLNEDGDPSLPNLRPVATALGVSKRDLFVASGQVMPDEVGLTEEPQPPEAPPTPEDRIMADDLLSPAAKAALIQTLNVLRNGSSPPEEPRRRKRA